VTARAIRCARPDEIAQLKALVLRSSSIWEEYRDLLAAYPEVIELPRDAVDEQRVRIAQGEDGSTLGFSVVLAVAQSATELDGLFVEPGHMRCGVGRMLIEDAARSARRDGAERIEVTAGPGAAGFYARVGFIAGGELQTRFGRARRMSMDLRLP